MKLVSVIIPVYSVETYILATIKSVINQTYKHLEILIVDDGSPDRSIEICQKYKDSRLKIIRQKNLGVSAAMNLKNHFVQFQLYSLSICSIFSHSHSTTKLKLWR